MLACRARSWRLRGRANFLRIRGEASLSRPVERVSVADSLRSSFLRCLKFRF